MKEIIRVDISLSTSLLKALTRLLDLFIPSFNEFTFDNEDIIKCEKGRGLRYWLCILLWSRFFERVLGSDLHGDELRTQISSLVFLLFEFYYLY